MSLGVRHHLLPELTTSAHTLYLLALEKASGYHGVRVVRELSKSEQTRYRAAVRHLDEFRTSQTLLPIVNANGAELEAFLAALPDIPTEQLQSEELRRAAAAEVNRRLANYLTATRLFLDQTQTRLSRRYGKSSAELRTFLAATNRAFDESAAYRICCKLRNFLQHCGLPIQNVSLTSRLLDPQGDAVEHSLRVSCSVDYLLEHYQEWGKSKPDLESRRPFLDIGPLIPEFTKLLHRVDTEARVGEEAALRLAVEHVVAIYGEVESTSTSAAVGHIIWASDRESTITFLEAPRDILRQLGASVGGA